MASELITLDHPLPLKAYPKNDLDSILKTQFVYFIAKLLSMKADSEEKILDALPAIKKHCWSLGFNEIKKMFEMYADGELSLQPKTNYFDRVLVGQIFNEYRKVRTPKKKQLEMPQQTEEEKEMLIYSGIVNCFDEWVQTKSIINGYAWVELHLRELGILSFSNKEKKQMWDKALQNCKTFGNSIKNAFEAKTYLKQLEEKGDTKRKVEYQLIRLDRFFAKIHAKGKHIKDFI